MNRDQEGQKNTERGRGRNSSKDRNGDKVRMIHRDGDREIARETDRRTEKLSVSTQAQAREAHTQGVLNLV